MSTGMSPTTNPARVHLYGIGHKKVRDSLCKPPFHSSFLRRKYSILFVSNVSGEIVGGTGIPRQIKALRRAESSHHVRGCENKRVSKARTDTALFCPKTQDLIWRWKKQLVLTQWSASVHSSSLLKNMLFFFFLVFSGLWSKARGEHPGTQGLVGVWMCQFLCPYFSPLTK